MEQITPLPTPVSTAIRSSLIIPSFPQILSELVQNSLDAGSKSIDVTISLVKGNESIRVKDDGCGIGREGLRKVGKRFRTSKTLNESNLGSVGSYGFRGEALSSIASLSLLTLTTRSSPSEEAYTKIIKSSKTLYFGIDPSRTISTENGTGTIITVKEMFNNIPVRRAELSKMNEETLMKSCKKIIEVLALSRPGIKWLVIDEKGYGDRRLIMDIQGTKSSVHIFRSLYGNALVQRVQNIRVSAGAKRVDGFISLSGDITKSHQHLYINNYPITRSDLHLAISKRFSNSRFGQYATSGQHDDLEDVTPQQRRSPRRLERHPIYVLNVSIPSEEVDVSFEPAKGMIGYKDYSKVQALLLAVVDEFLKKNEFDRIKSKQPSASPDKASPTKYAITTNSLHGKSPLGKEVTSRRAIEAGWDLTRPSPLSFSAIHPPTLAKFPQTSQACCTPVEAVQNRLARVPEMATSNSPSLVPPTPPLTPFEALLSQKRDFSTTLDNYAPRIAEKPTQTCQWITDLEKTIDTGILPSARRISALKRSFNEVDSGSSAEHSANQELAPDPLSARPITLEPDLKKTKMDIQLTKSSLSQARVIGQVDKKYVSVVIPTSNGEKAVVLVDQHAADERISVERILSDLCSGFRRNDIPITKLTKNIPIIILTTQEVKQLSSPDVLNMFRRWGIYLNVPFLNGVTGDYIQVEVEAVPTVLVGRLGKKEGIEMTRMIRGYLPVLGEDIGGIRALIDSHSQEHNRTNEGQGQEEDIQGDSKWGKEMRFMPREMLELANSKACRGAIMFQDSLNPDQQSRLISQLAQTKFPFMCAHGRPSMIPLIALKGSSGEDGKAPSDRRNIDWKSWKMKLKQN